MAKSVQLGKLSSPRQMNETEAAYMASMIDGEGSIFITAGRVKGLPDNYRLVVSITNTDYHLLETLAHRVGVGTIQKTIKENPAWKDAGQLIFNHEAAVHVLVQALPHLVIKADRAVIALEFMKLKREWSRSNNNRPQQLALREQLMALNARGKANQKDFGLIKHMTPDRRCTFDGCDAKHYGNGYCKRHYNWVFVGKSWSEGMNRSCENCKGDLPADARVDSKFCSVACKMKHHRAKGCYSPEAMADAPKCSEEGCDRPRHAQGICRRHYMQRWHASRALAAGG